MDGEQIPPLVKCYNFLDVGEKFLVAAVREFRNSASIDACHHSFHDRNMHLEACLGLVKCFCVSVFCAVLGLFCSSDLHDLRNWAATSALEVHVFCF